MKEPLLVIDAFVGHLGAQPLRGNPAAVVLLNAPRDAVWMQGVAAEMNLSETAFVTPASEAVSTKNEEANADFDLRWFTPVSEVKLCGHATLAAAHVLWETAHVERAQTIRFHTLSGVLSSRNEGERGWIDFPSLCAKSVIAPPDLSSALGVSPREPVATFKAGDDFLVSVPKGYVETLRPDFAWLRQISQQLRVRGIIVTSPPATTVEGKCDFISRFFAPAIGIDEDPVTGSAHAALAPFWGA